MKRKVLISFLRLSHSVVAMDVTSFRKCHIEARDALCTTWEKMVEIDFPASSKEEGTYKRVNRSLCQIIFIGLVFSAGSRYKV